MPHKSVDWFINDQPNCGQFLSVLELHGFENGRGHESC